MTSPAWMGLLGGLVGVAAAAIGVLVAAACIAVAFYLAGFVLFGVGIGQMAVGNVAAGFMLLGVGLLRLAFAILLTMAFLWVVRKGIPWICNAIGRIWRGIFSRRERAA